MRMTLPAVVALAATFFMTGASVAQEGCKVAQGSCSQMNTTCEKNCQNQNNPSACVARFCSVALNGCKTSGIWKSVASPVCWKTNNRS